MQQNPERDPALWETARKRVGFKWHLATYIIVNAFLWAVWYFTGRSGEGQVYIHWQEHNHIPWPIWPTLGWGVGLVFHYLGAFVFPKRTSVESEYEKLLRERERNNP